MREFRTSGSVWGQLGNWLSYHDGLNMGINMMVRKASLLLLAFIFLTGCIAQPKTKQMSIDMLEQKKGYVRIFIYRPTDAGYVWWPRIYVNDEVLADLPVFTYTFMQVKPGKYTIKGTQVQRENGKLCTGSSECSHSISIDVDGSKDVFVMYGALTSESRMATTGVGGFYEEKSSVFGLKETDSRYGKSYIGNCKLVTELPR